MNQLLWFLKTLMGSSWHRSAFVLLLCSLTAAAEEIEEPPSILANFEFRQSWGDLGLPGSIQVLSSNDRRAVRLGQNAEQLLNLCREDAEWREDPLLARLAHRNPTATISCRQRSSPSMHVVFYPGESGEREAWAHFDLFGPRNWFRHTQEVIRNTVTFGRTSSYEVNRSLLQEHARRNPNAGIVVPPPRYDFAEKSNEFLRSALSPGSIGVATFTASASLTLRGSSTRDLNVRSHRERIAANLLRNVLSQTIEFGAGAFLQQDLRFTASGRSGIKQRTGSALARLLVIPGRDGRELAFPRLAAAFGAPWVMHGIHPGLNGSQSPWTQSAFLWAQYAARSYWAEFKPEMQHVLRKLFFLPDRRSISVPELTEP